VALNTTVFFALTVTVRATDASGNTTQKSVTVTQFP